MLRPHRRRNSVTLLIYRVANFGADMALVVSIDGKDVGSFTEGANYSGYLSAGQHSITVRAEPNRGGVGPGRKTLRVQSWADLRPIPQRGREGI